MLTTSEGANEYESIHTMFYNITDQMFEKKGMYGAKKYGGLNVSQWAYQWQQAMHAMRSEARMTGDVSVETFRDFNSSLKTVIATTPGIGKEFHDLQNNLEKTFTKDILSDFNDGFINLEGAIERLMELIVLLMMQIIVNIAITPIRQYPNLDFFTGIAGSRYSSDLGVSKYSTNPNCLRAFSAACFSY